MDSRFPYGTLINENPVRGCGNDICRSPMSIFKAYDIRGKYPKELDETKARAIGWAMAQFIRNLKRPASRVCKIVVGRDVRLSSPTLSKNLIQGLLEGGARVTDIGAVTTPMSYFACGFYHFDGSVMVTASHNPPEYNGFKICRENAIALSETTGLKDIEKLAGQKPTTARLPASRRNKHSREIKKQDVKPNYKKFIRQCYWYNF